MSKKPIFTSRFFINALIVLVILVVVDMVLMNNDVIGGGYVMIPWGLLSVAGIGLLISTYRENVTGKSRLFQLLAGYSSAGFFLCVVLHNLLYGAAILAEDIVLLNKVLGFLEAAFFLIGVILCPIGFIVGMVGIFVVQRRSGVSS